MVLQLVAIAWLAFICCSVTHAIETEGKEIHAACEKAKAELIYPRILFAISSVYLIVCAVVDIAEHM